MNANVRRVVTSLRFRFGDIDYNHYSLQREGSFARYMKRTGGNHGALEILKKNAYIYIYIYI